MKSKRPVKTSEKQRYSRRDFIKTSLFALGSAGAISMASGSLAAASEKSGKLSLAMAGYNYDRTRALFDGNITIRGCDYSIQAAGIGDLNTHVFNGPQTLDVPGSLLQL